MARYQGRLSGPLLDRIDPRVDVHAVRPAELMAQSDGEPSAAVAARVEAARERQLQRQGVPNGVLEAGVESARSPAARRLIAGHGRLASAR